MHGGTISCHHGRAPAEAVAIRRRVFIEEQGVSEADEIDGKDADRTHFLARDAAGRAIGCACLRPYGAQQKVERVAVLRELRGSGLGAELMRAVEAHAREIGARNLVLHAQAAVVAFYEKLGWASIGPRFDEAGIEHQKMGKRLA
ncbi:MAG: GNAT family N-acetyltransferase [Deltaproteobacteria bacterium]|nr:GNAT family N-acetyltransferase [Deltaproteobacteria bacterium]